MKPRLYLLLIPFLLACTLSSAAIPAKLAASTPAPAPAPLPTDAPQQATVTANALHIRADHSYTAEKVGYLKRGDVVTVIGECSDGWVKIQFVPVGGIGAGFVNADYISGSICQ